MSDKLFPGPRSHYAWAMSAAGILFLAATTGRVLLGYRSSVVHAPHCWSVIGGSLDEGETPEEAAVREAHEEVRYAGPIILVPSFRFQRPPDFVYHNFIGVVPSQFPPRLNREHIEARWFDLDELPAPLHPGTRTFLAKAEAQILAIRDETT